MGTHVVVGAGAVGTATALELVGLGHQVRMVTRSGSGPVVEGIERSAGDASDPVALCSLVAGAEAVYNCANPPYHRWPELWPPIAAALLAAVEETETVLVTMGNLYGYGPVDHPMVETDPLVSSGTKGRVRAAMWDDALEVHRSGRAVVTEARASDFFGPGVVGTSLFGRNMQRLLARRTTWVTGDPDAPHSWTYVPDVGRTLAVLGSNPLAWGRAWHVPTAPPASQRQMAELFCRLAGAPAPKVVAVPSPVMTAVGLVSAEIRELRETRYQFDRPFVVDSTACTRMFGLEATPLAEAMQTTLVAARGTVAPVGS